MDEHMLPTEGAAEAARVLFDLGEALPAGANETEARGAARGVPRLRYANRDQASYRMCSLEDMVAEDHPVRVVWAYVQKLDLSELLHKIKAVEGQVGASATDPRIL